MSSAIMSSPPSSNIQTVLFTIQLLCAGMGFGLFLLGLILIMLVAARGPVMNAALPALIGDVTPITAMALFVFCLLIPTAFWLPRAITRTIIRNLAVNKPILAAVAPTWEDDRIDWLDQLPRETSQRLLAAYTSQSLITAALFEAAGMLAAVAIFLEGHWIDFVLWGLCLLFLFLTLPTKARLTRWLNVQWERIEMTMSRN